MRLPLSARRSDAPFSTTSLLIGERVLWPAGQEWDPPSFPRTQLTHMHFPDCGNFFFPRPSWSAFFSLLLFPHARFFGRRPFFVTCSDMFFSDVPLPVTSSCPPLCHARTGTFFPPFGGTHVFSSFPFLVLCKRGPSSFVFVFLFQGILPPCWNLWF